jgi:hypothetical protein
MKVAEDKTEVLLFWRRLDPHIDHGVYMSVRNGQLILIQFLLSTDLDTLE